MKDDFDQAAAWLSSAPAAAQLSNDAKLEVGIRIKSLADKQIYGLYKVALTGSGPWVWLVKRELI